MQNTETLEDKANKGLFWRLSSLQFLFHFAAASGTYLTVFLLQQGVSPDRVGFISAINSAIVIMSTPFWGTIADKIRSIRKVLLLCVSFAVVLWALVPASSRVFVGPLAAMYIIIPIGAFFRMPANSLIDAYTVQSAEQHTLPFGHIRLWGSIGWVLMCFILSYVLPRTGVEFAFYLYGFSFIPFFIILWNTRGTDTVKSRERQSFKDMQFGRLFKSYYFITYMFFSMLMRMPINISFIFLPFLVDSVGGDTAMIGLVTGFRALLEVPALLLMKPLREKFPLPVAIVAAMLIFFVEMLLLSRATSLFFIVAVISIHGFGQGLIHGAATNYVYLMAPEGLNSTAHTVAGAANSIAAIVSSIIGGIMIMAVGIHLFYAVMSAVLAVSILCFIGSLLVGVKILKIPIPLDTGVKKS